MRSFGVFLTLAGILLLVILFGYGADWGKPLYIHTGYINMPIDQALRYVASHNSSSSIVAYSSSDNVAVTYSKRSFSPTYLGITGKQHMAWLWFRWVVLGMCVGTIALGLCLSVLPERWAWKLGIR